MNRQSILAFLVAATLAVGASVWAQTRQDPTSITTSPLVLSGQDVGVRVAGPVGRDGKAQGQLVVKINGQWVDVVFPAGVRDLSR